VYQANWQKGMQNKMDDMYKLLTQEWVAVLLRLWHAYGKMPNVKQIDAYSQSIGTIPIGVLEVVVEKILRQRIYTNVPSPGEIWTEALSIVGASDDADFEAAADVWLEKQARKKMLFLPSLYGEIAREKIKEFA